MAKRPNTGRELPRRHFLKTAAAAMGAAAFAPRRAFTQGRAKYTRYNVMSPPGQKALASYAKGVAAMLKLPADHPHNWFRHAFTHIMDCPHGNWWFYVWHRGYVGYFEQTIRKLSGDPTFAMPYWDWTQLPQLPDGMFDGVLSPSNAPYTPYISTLDQFTSFIQPALKSHWNSLSAAQRQQLELRTYADFDDLWNAVTGFDPTMKPPQVVPANTAYAPPSIARYLTRQNPKLDAAVTYDVSPFVIFSGLLPTDFYNSQAALSFNSSKAPSHNTQTAGFFSTLEHMPHNNVHNYIGGVGPQDPTDGPYGYMTNFLSAVDPSFFLHHSNMDRLWDLWTRKQQAFDFPFLPTGADLATWSSEPFLFFVDGNGNPVTNGKAGDFIDTAKFEYDYEPGFGEEIVKQPRRTMTTLSVEGTVKGNTATASVTAAALKNHLSAVRGASLVAEITLPHPATGSSARTFAVLVGAPASVTQASADSPYFAGTISFFGSMHRGMPEMSGDATFVVPLPARTQVFGAAAAAGSQVTIQVVPAHGKGPAPAIKALAIRAR